MKAGAYAAKVGSPSSNSCSLCSAARTIRYGLRWCGKCDAKPLRQADEHHRKAA